MTNPIFFSAGSGGPDNSTLTIVLLVYQYAFKTLGTMGYAAALAFILAVVILSATLLQRKFFEGRVNVLVLTGRKGK
ncbi:hypothetical protein GCM10020331_090290 [Ectobacillus funiculus]